MHTRVAFCVEYVLHKTPQLGGVEGEGVLKSEKVRDAELNAVKDAGVPDAGADSATTRGTDHVRLVNLVAVGYQE